MTAGLALGKRSWTCPCCGAVLDRDGDAAENLRQLGLAAVSDDPVRDELRAWALWITRACPWRFGTRTAKGPMLPVWGRLARE